MKTNHFYRMLIFFLIAIFLGSAMGAPSALAQADDPTPPAETVRLIFIHHSTGENWLTDGYGDLGLALSENNYFVSDTNYGWGPDAIGDRTDILNWQEWFRSPETERYMQALFNENQQNSNYTRTLSNPGGENEVIMFKSCFPNSMLEGSPDDPPAPGDSLSVSNAKYIYNDLLNYFITRPDKLFIVITAPPVQDSTYADNARAFTSWLMQDWLQENNYPYNNVAVFDFYNILTHPDNHHRYTDGQIEWITSHGNNTLYYDSDGDDHPNPEGSRKATEEFAPLLNIFYHRWKANAPTVQPTEAPVATEPSTTESGETEEIKPEFAGESTSLIDDFEINPLPASTGWYANWDASTATTSACAPESGLSLQGSAALHWSANIAPASWSTCVLFFDSWQDLSAASGLSLYMHSDQPGKYIDVDVYGGTIEEVATYIAGIETTQEMADGWGLVSLAWDQFRRADWEENAGSPVDPSQVVGIGFGLGAPEGESAAYDFWMDDLRLLEAPSGAEPVVIAAPPTEESAQPTEAKLPAPTQTLEPAATAEVAVAPTETPAAKSGGPSLCPGAGAVGLAALFSVFKLGRRISLRTNTFHK